MSVVDEILTKQQMLAEQQAQKEAKDATKKRRDYSQLVHAIDGGQEFAPEDVIKTLEKCERSPLELKGDLDLLQKRRDAQAKVDELRADSLQDLAADRTAHEEAFNAAKAKWDEQREESRLREAKIRRDMNEAYELEHWLNKIADQVVPTVEQIDLEDENS